MVAGAVMRADGRVLIAQRPPGKPLAGEWEFPGGKLEAGETRTGGLARELQEELGIAIRDPRPLLRLRHAYPHGDVLIDMWVVTRFLGEPQGLEGQPLRWCLMDELPAAQLLPADRPIIRALRLPECLMSRRSAHYQIGDLSSQGTLLRGKLCTTVAEASDLAQDERCDFLAMGPSLPDEDLKQLCDAVAIPVFARGLALENAWALGATGVNAL